jgi:CheY-like chemotaxis protein
MMSEGAARTILVVDDDADSAEPLRLLLAAVNPSYTILVASNGASAVELARASHADMVIMDIQMPVMDGVEAAGRIRKDAADRPVLLIAVSGDVLRLPDVLATGHFDHAMPKPLDIPALLALVDLA